MSIQNDPQLYSSGYERNRLDRYWTHPWMTHELLDHMAATRNIEIPTGPIWECAAGRGDMSRALQRDDHAVYSTDIDMGEFDYESIGPGHERSFLDEFELPTYIQSFSGAGPTPESIITNPPYSEPWRGIADDFIEHGLGFFDSGITFMAMLLRSEFNSGKSKRRREKFGECQHYWGELVLTTRPRWDYGDPDAPENAAPRHNFSWFIWEKNCRLDNTGQFEWPATQIFSYMPKGFKT